jgi:hypothetical protein
MEWLLRVTRSVQMKHAVFLLRIHRHAVCVQILHLLMSEEYRQQCSRRRTPDRLVSTRVRRYMREKSLFKKETSRDDSQL